MLLSEFHSPSGIPRLRWGLSLRQRAVFQMARNHAEDGVVHAAVRVFNMQKIYHGVLFTLGMEKTWQQVA